MTKLVSFLGRKNASAADKPVTIALAPAAAASANAAPANGPDKGDIELDHELFFPIASQLGQENEAVRNLLIDAEHKIGELETIKRSIGKLVDPVSKTLRDYEEAKSANLSLQNVLNSTRSAHAKMRDELANAEKRARSLDAECNRLREVVAVAQQSVATHERNKTELLAELNARRAQITDLQRHVQQQVAELQQTREENRRHVERVTAADKRMVQLEGEAQGAQQKAMQAVQERNAVQATLDKAHNDLALTGRRLTETEKALNATQVRLKTVEASLAETQAERAQLSAAFDEANHTHSDEMNQQNSRLEALQARSTLTDSLLEEARQTLMARADEIRSFERRVIEAATANEHTAEKLAQVTALLAEREEQIRDLEQSRLSLHEHNQMLSHATAARDSAYGNAEHKIREQADLIQLLETQIKAMRAANEMQVEQMNAQLQREQLERTMAEGALESGRKDIARLLREIGSVQHRPNPVAATETPAARAA